MNLEIYDFNVMAPFAKGPADMLSRFGLSEPNRRFLQQVGLPRNALKFDPYSGKIMTFDCLAIPRPLDSVDLSDRAQAFVKVLGELMIVGVSGSHFACMPSTGEIYLVDSRPLRIAMEADSDAAERSIIYLNSSPQRFMECLCGYRSLRVKIDRSNDTVLLTKEAVGLFRTEIGRIDQIVLEKRNSFWRSIIDDLDVW